MSNDDRADVRSQTHGALAVASRLRLLDALRAADGPLDVRELAAACGLHVTTARFHLDVLTDAGLVTSRAVQSGTRGRPRRLYLPASRAVAGGQTGYELLSGILAARWAGDSEQRARRAEQAGWDWAGHQEPGPAVPAATLAEAAVHVNAVFAELGFEPDLVRDGDSLEIRLHACPFRAVAIKHPDVVCSMHRGLLRRALADVDAPPAAVSLQPFVQPHLCLARITPVTAPSPGRQIPPSTGSGGKP
ncbi:helix-turn-helix domain-containing protein [Micromonospora sp. H61]|uniref:helix-turn-helix transcriptional regulator n=1 Tax=Micromonospora TaxID=1873 RepID=UPI00142EBA76|nr:MULTISPECIES: helix-turn-helix domain-containing protein [Micromonospora]MBQ0994820.1 helix-turn-helix domain-containing protein [Micromonospora sp. H61]